MSPAMQLLRPPLLAAIRALPLFALLVVIPAFALDAREVYQNASPSVVRITTLDEDGDPTSFGSGFFVGNGRVIATNYHVIEDAVTLQVETILGDVFQIHTILGTDKERDIALLQSPQPGKPLTLSGRTHEIGEPIVAIGNPEGLDHTLSRGIISSIRRDEGNVVYQIDAAVSEGSSGSPVLDEHSEVIGIASFIYKEGQNLNFAYSARYVQNLLAVSDDVATETAGNTDGIWVARWRSDAEQGDAEAQFNLGWAYDQGKGVPQNHAEAAIWYRLAAEQGHANAQFNLGVSYAQGEGVPQDYGEAVKWYHRSAEQGYASAQFNLGYMYAEGRGVSQNYSEAVKWYRRAAEQGDTDAQYRLGQMYRGGKGIASDLAMAVRWYRRAAEQGHPDAQHKLGVMYINGFGVRKDQVEAVRWYRRAAEQGHADAQFNLGGAYSQGSGLPKNRVESYIWTSIAAANGHEDAERFRDYHAKQLPTAVLYAAQQEAERRHQEIQSQNQ